MPPWGGPVYLLAHRGPLVHRNDDFRRGRLVAQSAVRQPDSGGGGLRSCRIVAVTGALTSADALGQVATASGSAFSVTAGDDTHEADLIVETGVGRITLDQQGHLTLDAEDFLF